MICKVCGERMEGDGYSTAWHCPWALCDDYWDAEPDSNPVYCRGVKVDDSEEDSEA